MTAQLPPDTPWDETKADKEWADHRKAVADKTVFASEDELARLRELRMLLLNAPIRFNQFAERVRAVNPDNTAMYLLASDIQQYGLQLKRLAEEAR